MTIQVIGSGSFGIALARVLALNGHDVYLWARNAAKREELRTKRHSSDYLPEVILPDRVQLPDAPLASAEMAVIAAPSHALREVIAPLPLQQGGVLVSVTKGIEQGTLLRMSEIIASLFPDNPVVALSGPSHAEEVAKDKPASLVAASSDPAAAELVQQAFRGPSMRVYTSDDVAGVELGGALKNVIAIAAGAVDGLELGDNAKAALITRGLAEISRLGEACGAQALTFAGLSGMGDLIATCCSGHSRNRAIGEQIARGRTLKEILSGMQMVAEGVTTTKSARALAARHGVDMPIAEAVHQALFEGVAPAVALARLMMREAKPERG
jgi:glycerol-3-phosphate dehydrogenase (NAD(P)+)